MSRANIMNSGIFNQVRSIASRGARDAAATGTRKYSAAVNPILQQVVYGEESKVREVLEAVKSDAAQLSVLLSDTGTVKDYSGRTITNMTLLQAAAASGDVEMSRMLKNYMTPEEFSNQLAELFPEGLEAHDTKQQQEAFKFDAVREIIRAQSVRFPVNAEGTGGSSGRCLALDTFRDAFNKLSSQEKIFNPYHLLRAFEALSILSNQCELDLKNGWICNRSPIIVRCDLFWCEVIGYIQRFVPACYAQAFVQGLCDLVKVDGYHSNDWHPRALKRSLELGYERRSYFSSVTSFNSSYSPTLGYGFAVNAVFEGWCSARGWGNFQDCGVSHGIFLKALIEQKQRDFSALLCSEPTESLTMDNRYAI